MGVKLRGQTIDKYLNTWRMKAADIDKDVSAKCIITYVFITSPPIYLSMYTYLGKVCEVKYLL